MKKLSIFAAAAVLGFGLASCGGSGSSIEYGKAYLTGTTVIMDMNSTIDVKLEKDNKAIFDMTVDSPKPVMGGMELNKVFDLNADYKVEDKNYVFTIHYDFTQMGGEKFDRDFTAVYDAEAKTHSIAYKVLVNGGQQELDVTLSGALPL